MSDRHTTRPGSRAERATGHRGGRGGLDPATVARALGWFSIGLGVVELVAARRVGRAVGLGGRAGLVRAYGAREIATGIGLLSGSKPAPWLWGRVAGDALDLATLGAAAAAGPRRGRALLATAAVAGVTAVDLLCTRALDDAAPASLAHEPEVERSLTVGKSAEELHRLWRDPATLPRVMAHVAQVRMGDGGGSHWRIEGPLGRAYEWDAETVDDRPGESTGWRSLPGGALTNEGSIRFRPAPGGRGTVATLRVRFDPPGGVLGDAALKLLGNTPLDVLADKTLRRFKSLAETGEIPTTERQPAARADTR